MLTHQSWLLSTTFFLSIMGFSLHRSHLLSALLCLEGMMLSIFISLALWVTKTSSSTATILPVIMLTFSACEAGVGLGLMIATARTHGSDNLNTFNLLKC
uniref:NADH-ubiquinone oxidoreductase chain 4L n=1 Tax=Pristimantis fenestratus TaxID=448655 RepID=A0A0S2A2U3_9NEOB|nr:NADH dehydrogenase subunit 4L [Pristimantis fenestratus]